jgi:hypothetical protein
MKEESRRIAKRVDEIGKGGPVLGGTGDVRVPALRRIVREQAARELAESENERLRRQVEELRRRLRG